MRQADWVRHLAHLAGGTAALDELPPLAPLGDGQGKALPRDREAWRRACGGEEETWQDLVEAGGGPLQAWKGGTTVEVWTEEELASLHALWRLARRQGIAPLRQRLFTAARWHMEHTQPDNATNRPWAIHVFLLEGSPEGLAYAETLLHGATALRAVPEPVSAWILRDAAGELRTALETEADR